MNITKEMICEFNRSLKDLGCSFRIKYTEDIISSPCGEIVIANDLFVNSAIINLSDRFYKTLDYYFEKRGIKLNYNNTRSIFWGKREM